MHSFSIRRQDFTVRIASNSNISVHRRRCELSLIKEELECVKRYIKKGINFNAAINLREIFSEKASQVPFHFKFKSTFNNEMKFLQSRNN